MILNLGSLAFNANIESGGGTPAWGTELGQGEGYRFQFEGAEEFLTSMVYKSIPDVNEITCPLGKGGGRTDDYEFVLGSVYDKVYVNGIKIPEAKFILLVVKTINGNYHVGRRSLKYNPRMTYHGIAYNDDCYKRIPSVLGIKNDAAWFIDEIFTNNQEELHFVAYVLDANHPKNYASNEDRKNDFVSKIKAEQETNKATRRYTHPFFNIDQPLQQIFYGAPGTGKSHEIEQLTNGSVVFRTTFHPDSDYSTFVGAYKPIMREVPMTTVIGTKVVPVEDKEGNPLYESKIQYEFVPQAFAQAYVEAWKDLDSPVFLVIEEINRGNCAQIFGDIFQLLDRRKSGFSNYYIVPDEDLHQYIAKAFKDGIDERAFDIIKTGQNLCLPPNLYIWATMNTSDQSLFPIDSAFKRRWDWQYIPIEDAELNWKINVNGNKYDWWKFLQAINKEVFDLTLSEDKQLGYFFVQAKDNVIDAKVLVNKVFFYLWNDVFKDFDLDNSKVFRYADGPKSICFKDFYVSAGEIKEEIAEQILINLGLEKEA